MTRKATIEALLAAAAQGAGDQDRREARVAARVAWVKERIAALKAAQERADEAWAPIFEAPPPRTTTMTTTSGRRARTLRNRPRSTPFSPRSTRCATTIAGRESSIGGMCRA